MQLEIYGERKTEVQVILYIRYKANIVNVLYCLILLSYWWCWIIMIINILQSLSLIMAFYKLQASKQPCSFQIYESCKNKYINKILDISELRQN